MNIEDNFSTPTSIRVSASTDRLSKDRYAAFVENAIEGIWRIDFDPPVRLDTSQSEQIEGIINSGFYSDANDAAADILGLASGKELTGRAITDFMDPSSPSNLNTIEEIVKNRFFLKNFMTHEKNAQGSMRHIINNIVPSIQDNAVQYIWGASLDVTDLLSLKEELAAQKMALEDKNIALKELVTHIELDKKEFKERIVANIENVVLPALDKINSNQNDEDYIKQIRYALKDLASAFGRDIASRSVNLTPREIDVCNMVKNGLSNKEVARTLKIALHTVEKHRRNARKKLGLTSKSINLHTYLNSL